MGNQLCAPWRKGYTDDDRQWTPRKDSHLLRLWAEIFQVQEENGDICWGRVSDDVVPVNITCVQNNPTTVFQITAYSRHVEKIFDVRIIQPGTRVTQASECFVHWKDSKLDREWGLNFTSPADARCFRDCCSNPVNHNYSRKAASSGSLRTTSPKRCYGPGGGMSGNAGTVPGPGARGRSASNPTSPVGPRRAVSSPEELASVQDAIDAGFVVMSPGGGGGGGGQGMAPDMQSAVGRHYGGGGGGSGTASDVSAIATGPRVHRQPQRVTQRVQNVFGGPEQQQQTLINGQHYLVQQQQQQSQRHACENLYSQVTRPAAVNQQARRDDPPTYVTAAVGDGNGNCNSMVPGVGGGGILMHHPIAEREIPYEQYSSRSHGGAAADPIYSSCRVTPRFAPNNNTVVDGGGRNLDQQPSSANGQQTELRQFSREPTVISFDRLTGDGASEQSATANNTRKLLPLLPTLKAVDESSNAAGSRSFPVGISAGFDSNTLKRMLQTLPDATSPVDRRQHRFDNVTRGDELLSEFDDPELAGAADKIDDLAAAAAEAIISNLRMTSPPPSINQQHSEVKSPPAPTTAPPRPPLSLADIDNDVIAMSAEAISGILRPILSRPDSDGFEGRVSAALSPADEIDSREAVSDVIVVASSADRKSTEKKVTDSVVTTTSAPTVQPDNTIAINGILKPAKDAPSAVAAVTPTSAHQPPPPPPPPSAPVSSELKVSPGVPADTAAINSGVVVASAAVGAASVVDQMDSCRTKPTSTAVVKDGAGARQVPAATVCSKSAFIVPPSTAVRLLEQQQQQLQQQQQQPDHQHLSQQQQSQHNIPLTDATENESGGENGGVTSGNDVDGQIVESNVSFLPYDSQAIYASKSTAVRKTGWVWIRNWLVHKMVSIVAAPNPEWNRYWICLKGTTILFYAREQTALGCRADRNPRHALVVSGSIAHKYPDYPDRENVLALSTAFGDAYLIQTESDAEADGWMEAIHMSCASSFARHLGREGAVKLLQAEIHKLENSIDLDLKMKKMAGMQQSHMANDQASRQALERQMVQWDENLEKLHVEQYQLRCYLSALQGTNPPSTKSMLASMSKATKAVLAGVGAGQMVSAFHALVSARTPLTMTGTLNQASRSQQAAAGQGPMSTFKADTAFKARPPRSPRPCSVISTGPVGQLADEMPGMAADANNEPAAFEKLITVYLPDNQSLVAGINENTTVQDLLEFVCSCCHLNQSVYFIRFNMFPPGTGNADMCRIPDKSALVFNEDYHSIELCAKLLFQTELVRTRHDQDFGFAIEAKVSDGLMHDDELCVIVSDVTKGGPVALKKGLQVGDELLVLNGLVVSQLDMVYVETLLDELDAISLTVRSCRSVDKVCQQAAPGADCATSGQCPPNGRQQQQQQPQQQQPLWLQQQTNQEAPADYATVSNGHVLHGLEGGATTTETHRTLTVAQRICKVIVELIETERQYVRDLNCLIDWYLEPLKAETFLSSEDIERLFGNIQEIVLFQKQFLTSIEQAVEHDIQLATDSNDTAKFKKILFSLSSAFLYYAHHFKLYSSFCASHSKAQKVLISDSNIALQEFLRSRNPNQQHSATLESFLIKPIQRILKYPLLLRQLSELTDPNSEEHGHLCEALHGMEAVAEHINEMQKIYEEYGTIFEDLSKQYRDLYPTTKGIDLNVGELQMYGTVNWLNAGEELGKVKKGTELLTLLFIFKSGVVLMAQERVKGKRKPRPGSGRTGPPGTDSPESARYKTAIPVDLLQVRATPGDAHECHGIWEMVHCSSERDLRPERVFQFASSQEARRDFIRTIQQTIHDHVTALSAVANTTSSIHQPTMTTTVNQSYSSGQTSSLSSTDPTSSGGRRPAALHTSFQSGTSRYQASSENCDDQYGRNSAIDQQQQQHGTPTYGGPGSVQSYVDWSNVADLTRANLAEHSAAQGGSALGQPHHQQQQLGSQSTLASDRGGARLLLTSHDPAHYSMAQQMTSSASVSRSAGDPAAGSSSGGSPIWKRRYASSVAGSRSAAAAHSPASNDDTYSDGSGDGGSNTAVAAPPQKQRVTFRIPPSAYIETEDTDC